MFSPKIAGRAEYYRLFLKGVGVDAEAVNVADPQEYTLKTANIKVHVVPMNDAGPGPASPTVGKVVGA